MHAPTAIIALSATCEPEWHPGPLALRTAHSPRAWRAGGGALQHDNR